MTPSALRKFCLGLTGATEEFPFDPSHSVFKVAGKMFALSSLHAKPLSVSLKCDPDMAIELRIHYPAITGGYH